MVSAAQPRKQGPEVDREALAHFLHDHREEIKEGFRARFASGELTYYDSSDFFATVLRRADQLTSSLDRIATHDVRRMLREIVVEALRDCARSARSEQRMRSELRRAGPLPSGFVEGAAPRAAPPEREEIDRLRLSPDEMALARLRSSGMQLSKVAASLGVSAAAVRMRWIRLVGKAKANWGYRT